MYSEIKQIPLASETYFFYFRILTSRIDIPACPVFGPASYLGLPRFLVSFDHLFIENSNMERV